MNFQEFIKAVKKEVEQRTGKVGHVYPVLKNNGTVYQGLVVYDPVLNISPTIYLDPYFHRYADGQPFEEVVDDIVKSYQDTCPTKDFDISVFRDFDKAKSRIIMKVVNTEKNKKLLQKVPNIPFYDLSIVFLVDVTQAINEVATILIYNQHLKLWDVDVEELYNLAQENTPRQLQPRLDDLHDVFEYITGEELPFLGELGIQILTNHLHIHGATCIAYPELLKEVYDIFEDNVVIIPSSINEVLVFPEKNLPEGYSLKDINGMIQEANNNHLTNVEILSDHVYRFNGTELEVIG